MNRTHAAPLKHGAVETLLGTSLVRDATREALRRRLEPGETTPACFDAAGFATLRAVCERLVPQAGGERRVDLAERLDASLAEGLGDGWRFDDLPTDREAIVRGLRAIDETAAMMFARPFRDLPDVWRDTVLSKVQDGSAPGELWKSLPPARFFEELLGQVATLFYAHPYAYEAIGFVGMADVEGFWAIGLNRRDAIEHKASDAPL